jgi:transcriptional regulator with XRE-family HTH domain
MPRKPSPKKSALPKREIEICQRLKSAREVAGKTQAELAAALGIPKDRLSNYEKFRAPLRCELALRICRQLIVSEEWLATGTHQSLINVAASRGLGPLEGDWTILHQYFVRHVCDLSAEEISRRIPPGALFSRGFDEFLRPRFAELVEESFYYPRIVWTSAPEIDLAATLLQVVIGNCVQLIGPQSAAAKADPWLSVRVYTRGVFEMAHSLGRSFARCGFNPGSFQQLIKHLMAVRVEISPSRAEKPLHDPCFSDTKSPMPSNQTEQSLWEKFLPRLRASLASPGRKKELAGQLKVEASAVSQWISERESAKSMPSAANLLELQKWVEEFEEKKQKSVANARTSATPKKTRNQQSKNNHEKPKTSHRKK